MIDYDNQYGDQEDPEVRRRREEEEAAGGISGDQRYAPQRPQLQAGGGGQLQPQASGGGDRARADALNRSLGIDGGNIDSYMSGRAGWDEYERDQRGRAGNYTGDRMYDSQGPEINNGNNGTGGQQGAGGQQSGMQSAYSGFLNQPTQAPQVDLSPLTQQIQMMQQQQQQERDRQQQERASLRELIMSRMSEASKPVDPNASGIKEQLSSQRLARQRSAERQQSQTATRMASEGLGDSGAMDTALSGIEQQRGEGESSDIADVMGQEHQAKRQELMQLYQMAVSSGDSEMARNVQQQLAGIDAEIQKQGLAGVNDRFGQQLGFQKSSFMDNLGLQLMMAQMGGNQQAAGYFR